MRSYLRNPFLVLFVFLVSCSPKPDIQSTGEGRHLITFREELPERRIDILVGGRAFTSYRWPDGVFKPILYPIISAGGSTITRGFPLEPREGESNDHRHQVGNWLNFGNVNGFDFWGNGHTGDRLPNGGEIRHDSIVSKTEGTGEATLITKSSWLAPNGTALLDENTEYHFFSKDSIRIIDRVCKLTANASVVFQDTKEGMFGLRVSRALELPSKNNVAKVSSPDSANVAGNEVPGGNYRSSEGVSGEDVWGTRARWMSLAGTIHKEEVSVIMMDHPENISYPTWWHARPYGLFSANPLGAKDFTKGAEELNFSLDAGESATFRYRIVIISGKHPSDRELNAHADDFAKKYQTP